jgi:hypothetical protein
MNKYIITEEQLIGLIEDCPREDWVTDEPCDGCEYFKPSKSGKNQECNFDRGVLGGVVRSHYYQSERDKVLDEVLKKIDWRFNDTERGRMVIEVCKGIIEELRQQAGR